MKKYFCPLIKLNVSFLKMAVAPMQNKLFPLVLEFCFEKIYSSEDKWDIIIMFKIKTLSPMSSISEIEPIPCTARATIFWFVLRSALRT